MTPATPQSAAQTNLAWLHQEALTVIVRIRSGRRQVTDANHLRGQIGEALLAARDQALKLGYSDQTVKDAQFALVSLLDSTIVELGSPVFQGWIANPLVEEMFGAQVSIDAFFRILERLMAQPDTIPLADTLEVYLLCMLLGYGGSTNDLAKEGSPGLRDKAMERLFRIRGRTEELSTAWRPPENGPERGLSTLSAKRLPIVAVLGLFLTLGLLFGAYKIAIGRSVSELSALIGSTGAQP
jgi:type IV/VI secretion system ImpK/VasF family protein